MSTSEWAAMITNSNSNSPKEQHFTDSFLFFGSTGLIGSQTLHNFLNAKLYYEHTHDLQSKLENFCSPDIYCFTLNKCFYCFNRKLNHEGEALENSYMAEALEQHHPKITYGSEDFFLKSSSSSSPPASQSSNISLADRICEETGSMIIKSIPDSNDIALDYRLMKQLYHLEFLSKREKVLAITFKLLVIEIVYPNSSKWSALLPQVFSGTTRLRPSSSWSNYQSTFLPPLHQVSTMICTLGSSSKEAKKCKLSRYNVDYKLALQLTNTFVNCENKRVVIITTFNNGLISHIFPYFRAKSKLENDLRNEIVPKINQLIIIRPGPLIGSHARSPRRDLEVQDTLNSPRHLGLCKKVCWDYKKLLIKEIYQIGFKVKASEILAKTMYRKPGSWLLGYCIPASKTALVVAIKSVEPSLRNPGSSCQIISSEQIDYMV